MIMRKTNRGFNHEDLTDKYGAPFYIRQSSVDMSDVWLGITAMDEPNDMGYQGNKLEDRVYAILIDDDVWKKLKKARRMCRRLK
jgi:hypothetical protein